MNAKEAIERRKKAKKIGAVLCVSVTYTDEKKKG